MLAGRVFLGFLLVFHLYLCCHFASEDDGVHLWGGLFERFGESRFGGMGEVVPVVVDDHEGCVFKILFWLDPIFSVHVYKYQS
jgi:hypothetical protein